MRSILIATALLLIGSAADAQTFYGDLPPPGFTYARPAHPHWHCKVKFDGHGPKKVCRWGW